MTGMTQFQMKVNIYSFTREDICCLIQKYFLSKNTYFRIMKKPKKKSIVLLG